MSAVAVALLGAASASCSHSPSAADCPQAFDVLAWCVGAGTCDIDGVVLKACLHEPVPYPDPDPGCEAGAIGPGASLTINIESLWPLLGTRDDLLIYEGGGPDTRGGQHVPAFNAQRLFYDDTPVDVGIADARHQNVPRTVRRIVLRNDDPQGTLRFVVTSFEDTECPLRYPVEPLSRSW